MPGLDSGQGRDADAPGPLHWGGITQDGQAVCSPHPPSEAAKQGWPRAGSAATREPLLQRAASQQAQLRQLGRELPEPQLPQEPATGNGGCPERRHIPEDTKDVSPAIPWLLPSYDFETPVLAKWQRL